MSVQATIVETGEEFEIGPDVDERSREIIERVHLHTSAEARPGRFRVECREHDDSPNPVFADRRINGKVHGVYIKLSKYDEGKPNERWVVSHFDRRDSHVLRVGEGDDHKWEKDEWCNAGAAAGWPSDKEVYRPQPNGRRVFADVLIQGSAVDADIEVQRSWQSTRSAKARTTGIRNAGMSPFWSCDRLTSWNEANAVPNVRTNDLTDALSSVRPTRDLWQAVGGIREVYTERCTPRDGRDCPTRGRGKYCGKLHPRLRPMGMRVYEVAERAPAGDLVPLKLGKLGEPLVSAADHRLWLEMTGEVQPSGLVIPEPRHPISLDSACAFVPRTTFGEVLDERMHTQQLMAFASAPPPVRVGTCTNCRERPAGVNSTTCQKCFNFPDKYRWDRVS